MAEEQVVEQSASPGRRFSVGAAICIGVFLFAFLVRLPGLGWGLKNDLHNASYHPDEDIIFGHSRSIVPGQGQFVPHFYNYGTLYLTILRVASDITSTYTGGPKEGTEGFSFTNPQKTDWDWVSRCNMAGRFISVLAGAGTALIVCLMTRRFFSDYAGGLAGLFMAVAPAHVIHSRFQTVDVMATFFLCCSFLFAIRVLEESDAKRLLKDSVWCGAFAGLSAGTKYTGVLALISLAIALLLRKGPKRLVPMFAGFGASILAFLITTPGALLETDRFWDSFSYEMQHMSEGHEQVFTGTPSGYIYHLLNLMTGIGPVLVLMGLAGLAWAAWRKHKWAWVLLAFFVPYYLLIGKSEVKFIRYTFPLYPVLAVGFGYAMVAAHRKSSWSRLGVGLGILGLGGFPYGGLATAFGMTRTMMGEDARDQAARYLKQGSGDVGFVRDSWFWSPPLYPDAADPLSYPLHLRLFEMQILAQPPIEFVLDPNGNPTIWSPELVDKRKPERVAYSSFQVYPVMRMRVLNGLDSTAQIVEDQATQFWDGLNKAYTIDRVFGVGGPGGEHPELLPEDFLYTEPVVWVWKLKAP